MQTAPYEVTTRLNSFHDHFDRSLDPFLVRPKTLTKLKIFIHPSQPKRNLSQHTKRPQQLKKFHRKAITEETTETTNANCPLWGDNSAQ